MWLCYLEPQSDNFLIFICMFPFPLVELLGDQKQKLRAGHFERNTSFGLGRAFLLCTGKEEPSTNAF